MTIYFVRHGESILTEANYQLPDTPLSEHGLGQAKAIAKRFQSLPIQRILSSTYARALQTAKEIEKITSVPLQMSELLIERKMPAEFLGKSIADPEILSKHDTIREHFYKEDWHYADEENYADIRNRAKAAIKYIQSLQVEEIVVVTHGYFLTVLVFQLLFGDSGNHRLFRLFRDHTVYTNTGLTVVAHKDGTWRLLTWNDYAHLGDDL